MNAYQPAAGYEQLRQVVEPSLARLPAVQLRTAVDSQFGEGAADAMESDLEGIFGNIGRALSSAARDVGRFAQQAAPAIATVGAGALQGAMAGSAAGLPGIIAGAAVGGTGAGLSRYGRGTARDVGGALSGITSIASQFSPMGRTGSGIASAIGGLAGGGGRGGGGAGGLGNLLGGLAGGAGGAGGGLGNLLGGLAGGAGGAGGGFGNLLSGLLSSPQAAGTVSRLFGGGSAASQLSSLLQRPEVQQALGAMRLGPLGRRSIPVGAGGGSVPTAAFAQLLGQQLGEAAAELAESAPGEGEAAGFDFMRGESGEYEGDPTNVQDRATRLWSLLNEAQADRFAEAVESELSEAAEGYDADAESEGAWDGWVTDEEAEWAEWAAEQEFLDSLELADADTIEASLGEQEASYVW